MRMIQSFFQFFQSAWRGKSFGILALVFSAFFLGTHSAFAADGTTSAQEAFASMAVLLIHGIVYISWMIIGLLGDLLSNDIVMHPNVVPTLKLFWTVFRNLINMGFVAVLLFTAIKTIFDFGGDGKAWKKDLTNVAGALVMVNFSWLMVTVLIDASSVLTNYAFAFSDTINSKISVNYACGDATGQSCTTAVYSMKFNKEPKRPAVDKAKVDTTKTMPMDFRNFIFIKPLGTTVEKDTDAIAKRNNIDPVKAATYSCGDASGKFDTCKSLTDYLKYREESASLVLTVASMSELQKNGPFVSNRTIVPLIAHNLLPLESFILRDADTKSFSSLFLDILFSLIMSIIAAIAFVVLFVILIMRVAVLWLALMASPFIVFYFFDVFKMKEKVKKHVDSVIHMAFLPAIFGFVLSVGFTLINTLGYSSSTLAWQNQEIQLTSGSLLSSTHPLFAIILYALVIAMFWSAIMWALKGNEFTKGITDKVQKTVGGGAKWLAKRPLYMDWIPTVSGGVSGKTDMDSLFKGAKQRAAAALGDGEAEQLKRKMDGFQLKNKEAQKYVVEVREGKKDLEAVQKAFITADHNPDNSDYIKAMKTHLEKETWYGKLTGPEKANIMMGITEKIAADTNQSHILTDGRKGELLDKFNHAAGGMEKAVEGFNAAIKKLEKIKFPNDITGTEHELTDTQKTEIHGLFYAAGITKVSKEEDIKKVLQASGEKTLEKAIKWLKDNPTKALDESKKP